MAVQDVTVVSIPVSDQERAKAFYVDTLGLELVRDDDSVPGIRWIQVAPKAGTTSLTLVTWFESMLPGSLQGLVLSSGDLQADYEALRAAGVQFQGPPQHQPWATEAVLFDPDGNSLVLQQPEAARSVRAGAAMAGLLPHAATNRDRPEPRSG